MSTDALFIPPKKKPNVLWLVGAGLALLLMVFFLQLFGPNPPIVVSPQTTYITSPLGADGLPDYEQYVLDTARDGVTPENNAAALLWSALWPGQLDPPQYAIVAQELGLEKIPSSTEALDQLSNLPNQQAIRSWLQQQGVLPQSDDEEGDAGYASMGYDTLESLIDQSRSRPWTSKQIPPLVQWVKSNKKPLDMLVEASHLDRCYLPSPSLLDSERRSLIEIALPGVQGMREAGRALATRAMWQLGEGRPEDAWADLLAAHRIARLTAQGGTLIDQLVGMAIEGIAAQGTLALLSHGQLGPDLAQQIQRDLASLEDFGSVADSIDSMERLMFVDGVIRFSQGHEGEMWGMIGSGPAFSYLNSTSVDWNVVLRKGNEFYDRFAAAARLKDRAARSAAVDEINADLMQLASEVHEPGRLLGGLVSPGRRSDLVAAIFVSLFLPAVEASLESQDRVNSQLELLRLAAALTVFRAELGSYPAKLDELSPRILTTLPVDIFGRPFNYQRDGDGYLLYSFGRNGGDDGGSNERWHIDQGRAVDDRDPAEANQRQAPIPAGSDDISIRTPTPKWQLPNPSATAAP